MDKLSPIKTILVAIFILPLFILGAALFFYIPGLLTYFTNTGVSGYFFYLFSFFLITQFFMLNRAHKSVRWPIAEGTVTQSRVKDDGDFYSPFIEYKYTVNHHEYLTHSITTKQTPNTHNPERPQKLVQAHPVGSTVKVYYNPENPNVSYLTVGVGWSNWFLFILFLLGVLISGGWTYLTWEGLDMERLDMVKNLNNIRSALPEFFGD